MTELLIPTLFFVLIIVALAASAFTTSSTYRDPEADFDGPWNYPDYPDSPIRENRPAAAACTTAPVVTVKDPNTGFDVEVSLFVDASGGIFGVDSSFLANTDQPVFNPFTGQELAGEHFEA